MSTNRDGKVAVVDAVRTRLDDADAAVVTEYRGLTVAEMAGAAPRAPRGGRRLQGVQEHPRAARRSRAAPTSR